MLPGKENWICSWY